MKMPNKQSLPFTLIWVLVLGLVSCSDKDCYEFKPNETNDFVSLKDCLENFKNSTTETRSDLTEIQITNIERKTYSYTGDGDVSEICETGTRSESKQKEFTVLNVSFMQDETSGYAFLTEDNQKIYFFTEEGLVSDTAKIAPLKSYINSIPEIVAQERIAGANVSLIPNPNIDAYETIFPLLRFAWDQGYPFNYYAPYCGGYFCQLNNQRGRQPIGCVSIAVAQIIANIGVYHNQSKYDFSEFPISSEKVESTQQAEIVGRFLNEIATGCKVNFSCSDVDPNSNGSTSGIDRVKSFLLLEKYNCSLVANKNIDPNRLERNLRNGYPHIRAGVYEDSQKQKRGHMWVVDGMKIKVGGGNYYYHCNWGWGRSSNGWTYDNPYTTQPEDGEVSYNIAQQGIYIDLLSIKPNTEM